MASYRTCASTVRRRRRRRRRRQRQRFDRRDMTAQRRALPPLRRLRACARGLRHLGRNRDERDAGGGHSHAAAPKFSIVFRELALRLAVQLAVQPLSLFRVACAQRSENALVAPIFRALLPRFEKPELADKSASLRVSGILNWFFLMNYMITTSTASNDSINVKM